MTYLWIILPLVALISWIILLLVALILAGEWIKYRLEHRALRRRHAAMDARIAVELKKLRRPKEKPECQACSSFISCSMAEVEKCPLLP